MSEKGILDGVDAHGYDGVWKFWKAGSLGLFGAFALILLDCARTLRRMEKSRV